MRATLFLPFVLLGACAANLPDPADRLVARVPYGDLALDAPAGRAALRERVRTAAADYCREHSDEVTPQLVRTETSYCLDTIRLSIVAEMPRAVRRAYSRTLDAATR